MVRSRFVLTEARRLERYPGGEIGILRQSLFLFAEGAEADIAKDCPSDDRADVHCFAFGTKRDLGEKIDAKHHYEQGRNDHPNDRHGFGHTCSRASISIRESEPTTTTSIVAKAGLSGLGAGKGGKMTVILAKYPLAAWCRGPAGGESPRLRRRSAESHSDWPRCSATRGSRSKR